MVFHVKTTLIIDDLVMVRLREEARDAARRSRPWWNPLFGSF